ncbi:MAG TPA: hypothetical protein VME45_01905 [Stellaceae bacterium]|nr:hypothetical protein [Stellaceae bacterium]
MRNTGTGVLIAFIALLVIVSVPVFSTVLPPLVDYPNHLARMHLIIEGGNQFYAVRWAPLPDLAEDLIVPALAHLVPLDIAGKLFLVVIFALIAGGTLCLNRVAAGRWQWWGLLGFLLLYDRILLWGFLNYLFGLGVAICGLALWLRLEERPILRAAASCVVALFCFFSHIAAFGVYALAILGVEAEPGFSLMRARRYRALAQRIAIAAAQFVLPAILFLFCQPSSAGSPISFTHIWRKADLLFSVFDNYSRPFDIACFVLFVALLGGLAWRGRLKMAPRLGAALAVLVVAYLLLPSQMLSGSGVDRRLPVAIFLLLVGASTPGLPRRAGVAIAAAIGAIFLLRMAAIERVWLEASRLYRADIAAIDLLPEHAKLAVAFPPGDIHAAAIPELHVATVAAARREAFVPTVFAYASQQPLAMRPPYDALAGATSPNWIWDGFVEGEAVPRAAAAAALKDYDFVVFADRNPFKVPNNACLAPLPSPSRFQLFKLRQGEAC